MCDRPNAVQGVYSTHPLYSEYYLFINKLQLLLITLLINTNTIHADSYVLATVTQ